MIEDSYNGSILDLTDDIQSAEVQNTISRALTVFSICIRNVGLYGLNHPLTKESAEHALANVMTLLAARPGVIVAVTESNIAMGSYLMDDATGALNALARLLFERRVSELHMTSGITLKEILDFAETLSLTPSDLLLRGGMDKELRSRGVMNIRVRSGTVPAESRLGKEPVDIYEEALILVEEAMRSVQTGLQLCVTDIRAVVSDSLQSIIADESALLALAGVRSYDRYLSEHSVNVCVLSMVLGKDLGLEMGNLLELGISAMLHDVGKVFIPPEIVKKPGKLSEQEWMQVRKHPNEGARALAGLRDLPMLAPMIALEHHIHCDGSGYPMMPNHQPHLLSRLVAVVDTYDALTTDRPYRDRWTPQQAMAWMLYEAWTQYDRQLMARFASRANLYPIGSLVRLNNGEIATIVGGNHKTPTRPTLKVLSGGGKGDAPRVVDLSVEENPEFEIEAIAQPAEVLLPFADKLMTA